MSGSPPKRFGELPLGNPSTTSGGDGVNALAAKFSAGTGKEGCRGCGEVLYFAETVSSRRQNIAATQTQILIFVWLPSIGSCNRTQVA